jgi:hypothetical protein
MVGLVRAAGDVGRGAVGGLAPGATAVPVAWRLDGTVDGAVSVDATGMAARSAARTGTGTATADGHTRGTGDAGAECSAPGLPVAVLRVACVASVVLA